MPEPILPHRLRPAVMADADDPHDAVALVPARGGAPKDVLPEPALRPQRELVVGDLLPSA